MDILEQLRRVIISCHKAGRPPLRICIGDVDLGRLRDSLAAKERIVRPAPRPGAAPRGFIVNLDGVAVCRAPDLARGRCRVVARGARP